MSKNCYVKRNSYGRGKRRRTRVSQGFGLEDREQQADRRLRWKEPREGVQRPTGNLPRFPPPDVDSPEVRDPICLHHLTRKQASCFGAARLSDGRFHFQRETGRFNAETCWTFLHSLRRAFRHSRRRMMVIADNASFHHAVLHKEWRKRSAEV